jgi:hypothetical protein
MAEGQEHAGEEGVKIRFLVWRWKPRIRPILARAEYGISIRQSQRKSEKEYSQIRTWVAFTRDQNDQTAEYELRNRILPTGFPPKRHSENVSINLAITRFEERSLLHTVP